MAFVKPKFIFLSAEVLTALPLLTLPIKYIDFWFYLLFIYDKLLILAPLLTLSGIFICKVHLKKWISEIKQGQNFTWSFIRLFFNLLTFGYIINLFVLLVRLKSKI